MYDNSIKQTKKRFRIDEYIFYRIYTFFRLFKNSLAESTSVILLSLWQAYIILYIIYLVNDHISNEYYITVISILTPINYVMYAREKRLNTILDRYQNESTIHKIIGSSVILILFGIMTWSYFYCPLP